MKTRKQLIAAALDINKVFSLDPAIDPAIPLAELKSKIMEAAELLESGDKGKFALNTVQVLVELKAPNAKFLLDGPTARAPRLPRIGLN
jgi:hypothetical protein